MENKCRARLIKSFATLKVQ